MALDQNTFTSLDALGKHNSLGTIDGSISGILGAIWTHLNLSWLSISLKPLNLWILWENTGVLDQNTIKSLDLLGNTVVLDQNTLTYLEYLGEHSGLGSKHPYISGFSGKTQWFGNNRWLNIWNHGVFFCIPGLVGFLRYWEPLGLISISHGSQFL